MITCTWCGTPNNQSNAICTGCAAPLSMTVQAVYVDLTSLQGNVTITIKRLPAMIHDILPSVIFALKFKGNTVSLTPKPEQQSKSSKTRLTAGDNSIAIAGNVSGNVVAGNNNKVTNTHTKSEEKDQKLALWLPANVEFIIISGNGTTKVNNSYPAEIDTTDCV